jgi:hypothetical protein
MTHRHHIGSIHQTATRADGLHMVVSCLACGCWGLAVSGVDPSGDRIEWREDLEPRAPITEPLPSTLAT